MIQSNDDREAIIDYRIERSLLSYKEAKYVGDGQFWNLAANRLYYSAFYMCMALLISKEIGASTHEGVSRMMNLHFVRTGLLDKEDSKLLGRLFRMRQTGDYNDLTDWTEEEIRPMFPNVEKLIHRIKALIDK